MDSRNMRVFQLWTIEHTFEFFEQLKDFYRARKDDI